MDARKEQEVVTTALVDNRRIPLDLVDTTKVERRRRVPVESAAFNAAIWSWPRD